MTSFCWVSLVVQTPLTRFLRVRRVNTPTVAEEGWRLSTGSRHTLISFSPQVRTNGVHHYWSSGSRRRPECVAEKLPMLLSAEVTKPPKARLKKDAQRRGNGWDSKSTARKRTFSLTPKVELSSTSPQSLRDGGAKLQHVSDKDLESLLNPKRRHYRENRNFMT